MANIGPSASIKASTACINLSFFDVPSRLKNSHVAWKQTM